jgi:tetratricopeptide (TPR) repeat protein
VPQERNYIARKEAERQRREMFDDALVKFKKGVVEEVGGTTTVNECMLCYDVLVCRCMQGLQALCLHVVGKGQRPPGVAPVVIPEEWCLRLGWPPTPCFLQALIDFENVLSLEPKNYLGDDFSRVTQIYRITQYNIACCYSMLDQADSGLEALNAALASGEWQAALGLCRAAWGARQPGARCALTKLSSAERSAGSVTHILIHLLLYIRSDVAGFEDYDKVRKDPNLANVRKSPNFTKVLNRYDEPIINEGAIKALKSLFSFGKKE